MSNFDETSFNESLFDFNSTHQDIDTSFAELQNYILKCINKHAPLRKHTPKEQKFSHKPWITESMQISIVNKDKLYIHLQNYDDPVLNRKYNKMKKILKKACFAAKCRFHERLFDCLLFAKRTDCCFSRVITA